MCIRDRYKYLRTKRIKLNGKKAHENDFTAEGDVVEMYIPDEFFGDTETAESYEDVYKRQVHNCLR